MIFYFSGTGNSKYVASKIGVAIGDKFTSISNIKREKQFQYDVAENEKIGFVFPVYFWGVPTIVNEFISKVEFSGFKNPYIYVVLTCGGATGDATKMFESAMKKSGHKVSASYSIPMVDNYVLMYNVATKKSQNSSLVKAETILNGVIQSIIKMEKGDNDRHKGVMASVMTTLLYPFYKYGRKTKKFFVDDKCVKCGQCMNICPAKIIVVDNAKPKWIAKQCVRCLACINRCPRRAIQYGKGTEKRDRYYNPNIK